MLSLEKQGMNSAMTFAKLANERDDAWIGQLADTTKIDSGTLRNMAHRLGTDHQVRLIWTLYEIENYGDDLVAKTQALSPDEPSDGAAPAA
jgi:hypothetical protein